VYLVPIENDFIQHHPYQRLTLRKAHPIQFVGDLRGELLDPVQEFLPSAVLLLFFLQPLSICFQTSDPFGKIRGTLSELCRRDQAALIGIDKPPPFRFNLTESALRGSNLLGKETLIQRSASFQLLVRPQKELGM